MKFAASLFIASVLAASTIAAASIPEVERRDVVEFDNIFAREFTEGFVGRALTDDEYELITREPSLGKFLKGAFKFGKNLFFRRDIDVDELDARELVELIQREPSRVGKFFKGIFRAGKRILFGREMDVEEVNARDFLDIDELDARDFEDLDELDARDFEDLDELDAREFYNEEDLIQRDPLFGLGGNLVERDLDFEDALYGREYEVDELD